MKFAAVALGLFIAGQISAQSIAPVSASLTLTANDVRVVPGDDGFHLIIRQKPGSASVMLTEAFELPDHKLATYSWKSLEPNAVNGHEKRLLNGHFLPTPNLFLVSSTTIADPLFGPSFEILVPAVMEYGSQRAPNSRYGKVDVKAELSKPNGKLWIAIRTFAKPYEDYTGSYKDNAFEFSNIILAQSLPLDGSYYVKGNEDLFRRLGTIYKARDAAEGVKFLKTMFQNDEDLVVCLDLTKSMAWDLKALKSDLLPGLGEVVAGLKNFRLGLLEYKDYGELWVTKPFPLSSDPANWIQAVSEAEAAGGGDIPEAVVEALDAGLALFDNASVAKKVMVVFGDAPQHDSARGKVKESEVLPRIAAAGVEVHTVMLPVTPF